MGEWGMYIFLLYHSWSNGLRVSFKLLIGMRTEAHKGVS